MQSDAGACRQADSRGDRAGGQDNKLGHAKRSPEQLAALDAEEDRLLHKMTCDAKADPGCLFNEHTLEKWAEKAHPHAVGVNVDALTNTNRPLKEIRASMPEIRQDRRK